MAEVFAMSNVAAIVFFCAMLAAAPDPAVSPDGAGGGRQPLRLIGHVRVTTPLCKVLLSDALQAVNLETDNDRRIADAVATLRGTDLDSSVVAKAHGSQELSRQYVALRTAAVNGNTLMRQFRDAAQKAPTAAQKADLLAFAQALDGALYRQKVLAGDLGGFVAYVDAHEPMTKDEHDDADFDAIAAENDARLSARTPFDPRDFGPTAAVPEPLSTVSKTAGDQLEHRALAIQTDESDAAAKIDPAFAGC